jgi:hypothetical protein
MTGGHFSLGGYNQVRMAVVNTGTEILAAMAAQGCARQVYAIDDSDLIENREGDRAGLDSKERPLSRSVASASVKSTRQQDHAGDQRLANAKGQIILIDRSAGGRALWSRRCIMHKAIKRLGMAVIAAASLLAAGGAQAQRVALCVRASNPYCEVCYCQPAKKGTGTECFYEKGRFGPQGETCVLCYTFGKCPTGGDPVIGFGP